MRADLCRLMDAQDALLARLREADGDESGTTRSVELRLDEGAA